MHFPRQIKFFHFKFRVNFNLLISFILLFFVEFINPSSAFSEWNALEDGVDGFAVVAVDFDSSGNLYVGGNFTSASGVSVNNLAKWDGSQWSSLGSGVGDSEHPILALVSDKDDNLYVGGWFTIPVDGGGTANNIAKWDGSKWHALGTGLNDAVHALIVDNEGNLYAGGEFTEANGIIVNYIAKWNGNEWSALNGGVTSSGISHNILSLAFDNSGNLYAGGTFDSIGGVNAGNIAKWDGNNWSALGLGISGGWCKSITFDSSDNLYAGGDGGGTESPYLGKWDGSEWIILNEVSGNVTSEVNGELLIYVAEIAALEFDKSGNLYMGGAFVKVDGITVNSLARWDGYNWRPFGVGMNSWVHALKFDNSGNLYVGGAFTKAGDVTVNRIAKCELLQINFKINNVPYYNGSHYNFGYMPVGGSGLNDFTIENTSSSELLLKTPLKIQGINSDQWSVINQPASTLAPGDSTEFTIRYSPTSTGNKSAFISIINSDGDAIPYTVIFDGVGYSPKGDLNGDGETDLIDAIIALHVLTGKFPVQLRPDYAVSGTDVNGDNMVGMEELIYILEEEAMLK